MCEDPHRPCLRVLEGNYRLVVDDLWILLHLLVRVDWRTPDPDLIEKLEPMLGGLPPDVPRHVGVHFFPLTKLIFLGPLEERIVPERLGHLLGRCQRYADVSVGGLEDPVGGLVESRGDTGLAAVIEASVEVVDERLDL